MVDGIDAYLMRAIEAAEHARLATWSETTLEEKRARLRTIIGLVENRDRPHVVRRPAVNRTVNLNYDVEFIRWNVVPGIHGEGLLYEPKETAIASIVVLPDCDVTPEQASIAEPLARLGCRVVVPMLINRDDTLSGHPDVRYTNQPHREFIYRAAYEMGHHVIGYEVAKVLAAIDWLEEQGQPIGIHGTGEGGLIALHAAALDDQIEATIVSGYIADSANLWTMPIYRNVWRFSRDFGNDGLMAMVAPRALIVDASNYPAVSGPPDARNGRRGAAPGALAAPSHEDVARQVRRARTMAGDDRDFITLVSSDAVDRDGSDRAIRFLKALRMEGRTSISNPPITNAITATNEDWERLHASQFHELVNHTQALLNNAQNVRGAFWQNADMSSAEAFIKSAQWYRNYFYDEIIGKLPEPNVPMNPRTRRVFDESAYVGYEVVLDVYDEVFAYGILLVPKDIQKGERRPVVVCQHGLEGRPQDVADPAIDTPAYRQFGCRLAEEGFVVFAPQNPYIGGDRFRVLQRKANPLGYSLFSFITRQHERIVEWLEEQPFVDGERIGFYGLSYGGKTAMRVPAILNDYCLSICSADYNEWIWKNVSTSDAYSYMFTGEYEMPEFNLGNTFNYAEMSWLIFPRPFMVERGHDDGVAPDEQVAYEYARTRRHYVKLGKGQRTQIEFFDGPHAINGVGTFEFLRTHLRFPEPARDPDVER